ncbi:hypothetical protein [Streptomyces dangxiongensis]|uniref:hypothetical protein n=1 Tax=Streptomyces dangxiongensis TaxID=1442032 RepID=UPI0013CEB697|nr:hypothetical protein [Streptomyces dangxiongensis]
MEIENQYVKAWRKSHECKIVSPREVMQLFDYLNTLSWGTSQIDWADTPGLHIPFEEGDPQPEWVDNFSSTPLGRHKFIMVAYAPDKEALLGDRDEVLADLDLLYVGAPGARYFCGADLDQDRLILSVEDFAEFSDRGVTVHLPDQSTLQQQ